MYFPIVDNTNLVYIGITSALSYQLPYEPIDLESAFYNQANGDNGNDNSDDPLSQNGQASMPIATAVRSPSIPIQSVGNSAVSPVRPVVDRYYKQPVRAPIAPLRSTTGGTYLIGTPQAPPDRRPGMPDKYSNKLDHYFTSYANRAMQTLNSLDRNSVDPWTRVAWQQQPEQQRSGNSGNR